ncbi:MAG TPA: ATP-binding protein, partial [Elusimicrobiota bacterium]|nr:ATP-binding protein [Elusimicrobiota bacterium]
SSALDEARARLAEVGAELDKYRRAASILESERNAARNNAASLAASHKRHAAEAAARLAQLEAECVRLEKARQAAEQSASGDSAALQTDLLKAQAVAASLRLELGGVRSAAARQEGLLNAQLSEARAALDESRRALSESRQRSTAESATRLSQLEADLAAAQAASDALSGDMSGARDAASRREEVLRRELSDARSALSAARRALADLPAVQAAAPASAEETAPSFEAAADPGAEPVAFVQPPVEPLLEPGWARLVRLVRPPVDSAYSHLRRLSATALTAGQKALLRMAAASLAQASDSLSSVELALEEGPAPGASAALPVLEQSLAAWEAAFRARGVGLSREFAAPLPDAAHDPKELRIALYHVLRNVLEAVPRGGRLAVRAWRGTDGGLRLEFSDDGPGFPPAWLARRFEPFAAPRRGRAGLGLSLVRRTLRRWGGDAEASSGPSGRGARLTLLFAPPPPPTPAAQ